MTPVHGPPQRADPCTQHPERDKEPTQTIPPTHLPTPTLTLFKGPASSLEKKEQEHLLPVGDSLCCSLSPSKSLPEIHVASSISID